MTRRAAPSKYKAVRTNGYASKKEAKRAAELKLLLRSGAIKNLREQVRLELVPKFGNERAAYYVADFMYDEKLPPVPAVTGHDFPIWRKDVCEDVKGMRTPLYVLKRKILNWRYGIVVRET